MLKIDTFAFINDVGLQYGFEFLIQDPLSYGRNIYVGLDIGPLPPV